MKKLLKWLKSFNFSRNKQVEPKFKHGETISVGNSTGRITEIYEMKEILPIGTEVLWNFLPERPMEENRTGVVVDLEFDHNRIYVIKWKHIDDLCSCKLDHIVSSNLYFYQDFKDKINDRIK